MDWPAAPVVGHSGGSEGHWLGITGQIDLYQFQGFVEPYFDSLGYPIAFEKKLDSPWTVEISFHSWYYYKVISFAAKNGYPLAKRVSFFGSLK